MRLFPPSRWAGLLALAILLAAAALAVEIATSGRTSRPVAAHAAALDAFRKASLSPGGAWSAPELSAARAALDAALLDLSRQENRLFVLRDFRPGGVALARVAALFVDAERLGSARRDEEWAATAQALDVARALEDHALALVAATTLPSAERSRLLHARLLLREAEALLRRGEVRAAGERGRRSTQELRGAVGPTLAAAERYRSQEQVATWRRWIEDTRRASRASGSPAILVLKEKNLLMLLARGVLVGQYDAEVGANALGLKHRQGDRATPEGRYRIVKKKDRGDSRYHRALLLDYPNAADRQAFAAARRRGEIPNGSGIGGLIEIHGEGGRGQNWTDGCIALRNVDMDELFARVGVGTRVTIVGGDGSDGAFSSLLARLRQPAGGS